MLVLRCCSVFDKHVSVVQVDDQGLVNTDPRNIAVPNTWVNLIPTDLRGLTYSRTPQMVSPFPDIAVGTVCSRPELQEPCGAQPMHLPGIVVRCNA